MRVSPTDISSATLHTVWDGYYLRQCSYADVREEVNRWYANLESSPIKGEQEDSWSWAKESFEIARKDAYHDGDRWILATPLPPDADPTKLREVDAPALTKQYLEKVESISKQRLFLSGRRLAHWLMSTRNTEPPE